MMIKRFLSLLLCLSLLFPVLAFAEEEVNLDELLDTEDVIDLSADEEDMAADESEIEEIFDESAYISPETTGHFPESEWELNSMLPEEDVVNILLIGLDSRPTQAEIKKREQSQLLRDQLGDNNGARKRNDVTMILSIDRVFGTLKITSISRDTLVQIPYPNGNGYYNDRPINEAFGIPFYKNDKLQRVVDSPERLIKTINHNFGLNIKYFVATNFYGVEEIIEYLGGVDVVLTKQEARYVNLYIRKNARAMRNSYDTHSEGRVKLKEEDGVQHLDGLQGLVFARYRTIAGVTDIVRTGRTRRLMQALAKPVAEKLKNKEISMLDLLVNISQYFVTNMNFQAMFNDLWPAVRDSAIMKDLSNVTNLIEEYRIPATDAPGAEYYYSDEKVKLRDMRQTAEDLQEFIYGAVYGFDD